MVENGARIMENNQKAEVKILQAAMALFIEKGRHGAKMQEIADRAGINKANLYAKIFEMVFMRFFKRLETAVQNDGPFEDRLRAFIDCYVDILEENPGIPLFLAHELSEGGAHVGRILSGYFKEGKMQDAPFLFTLLENAKRRGEISDADPQHFIMTLIGASIFFFVAGPIVFSVMPMRKDFDRSSFLQQRKQEIFKVLYYGVKPRGENR
jgi:TetR/AcrR family transcriptional regulator